MLKYYFCNFFNNDRFQKKVSFIKTTNDYDVIFITYCGY